jgi:LPXTG-site transpeptidase (sortase) family protein
MKNFKLNSDQLVFIGTCIIIIGVFILFYNYLESKKILAFETMNLKLYEETQPDTVLATSPDEIGFENDEVEDATDEVPTYSGGNYSYSSTSTYTGILEIPKINLKKGFYNIGHPANNVNKNVTVIEKSNMPDVERGNLILAAHNGNASISFFGRLYKLSIGDDAYVYYNGKKYIYRIVNIYFVEKTGKVSIYRSFNATTLTLITCTQGSNTQQTVYIAELQSVEDY